MTYRLLNLSKVIDKRLWGWASPLRQFSVLPPHILTRLEEKNLTVDKLKDMRKDEIGKKRAKLFECIFLCKHSVIVNVKENITASNIIHNKFVFMKYLFI